jgi:hypothetical protein
MSDTPQTDRFEKTYFDCPTSHVDDVFEYARELERENAALRADKERLDWLEKSQMLWEGKDWLRGPEFITRAALDSARKEGKP